MNIVPYILFFTLFFLEYFIFKLHILPGIFNWVPELLSSILIVAIILRAGYTRILLVSPKYIILFLLFATHICIGVVLNGVPEGAIIGGMRYYFKYVPFFLLPAVYRYSDQQLQTQLKVLFAIILLQLPVTLYQRFVQFRILFTGDVITGTLTVSSVLSIILISSICIVIVFYMRRRISRTQMLLFLFALFIPTTINETKGTVILLPLGLFIVLLYLAKSREARKKIIGVMVAFTLLVTIFFAIFDQLYSKEGGRGGLLEFFSGGYLEHYLYRGAEFDPSILKPRNSEDVITSDPEPEKDYETRIDRIVAPLVLLSSDPFKLTFGLGIGNVTSYNIKWLSGAYAYISAILGTEGQTLVILLWEIGVLGVMFYLTFFYFIFRDAMKLGNRDNIHGMVAAGWLGVVAIMVMSLPYKNTLSFNVIAYLFWYFSGIIAARLMWDKRDLVQKNSNSHYSRLASTDNGKKQTI